jgi:catechol 2,3-dioxygenase-like lactoylglutathione lyase family enzyme
MRIEHIGYPAGEPAQVAQWYGQHLGFRPSRSQVGPPYTHFLVDAAGQGVIEIYHYTDVPPPDYRHQHPLLLHLALDVEAEPIEKVAERLLAAGATLAKPLEITPGGDRLIMLRDPWGFPLQLTQRKVPLR